MKFEVINADCLEAMKDIPDGSIDACVTDPPYGMNLQPQRGLTLAIAGDTRHEAKTLWSQFVPEIYRIAKPNTAHLFFGRWSETWVSEILSQWFTLKGCIVWRKNQWGIGYYLRPQWELIWYCHKGTPHVPDVAISDVWDFPRENAPIHSCQKPVDLMRHAVTFAAPEGGSVVDPFAGVGSTGVACAIEGREFIGIEVDQEYAEVARARISRACGVHADIPRRIKIEKELPLFYRAEQGVENDKSDLISQVA
jgi:DNA modification methylase